VAAPSTRLVWTSGRDRRELLIDRLPDAAPWLDLGDFSAALRGAQLFDNTAVDLPGAIVALPAGQRLVAQFSRIVRQHYEAAGLAEYDYPTLAPLDALATFSQVFEARERVLLVGTADDFRNAQARAVLLPTGEPIIYSHWRKLVRTEDDLPLEMFRRTSFYRPWTSSRRGRHIFNTLEGADTFEFHCCYDPSMAQEGARRLFRMLRGLATAVAVPVLWSTRPPWSNHSAVSHSTIGGDCPLPSGSSLQVGTLYRQGSLFSTQFGIDYRAGDNERRVPEHVVGAVSRRLLLTHLCLGMADGGAFVVHPSVAPVQAHVVVRPTEFESAESILAQAARWLERGDVRVTIDVVSSGAEVARQLKLTRPSMEPLTVLLQGRRNGHDSLRVVVRRADTLAEVVHEVPDAERIPDNLLPDALADVAIAHEQRLAAYVGRRVVEVGTVDDVRQVLAARQVALCAMEFTADSHDTVASWKQGEILGFVEGHEPRRCVLSQRSCTTRAYVSPRA